jgi:hypothetical protein
MTPVYEMEKFTEGFWTGVGGWGGWALSLVGFLILMLIAAAILPRGE